MTSPYMEKSMKNMVHNNKPLKGLIQTITITEKQFIKMDYIVGEYTSDIIDSEETLIKAAGICVDDDYDNLGEQLLDYFELVQEYDGKKLFILVNLRSYLSDAEMNLFLQNIVERDIQILILESSEHPILEWECRHIVDADFCILC